MLQGEYLGMQLTIDDVDKENEAFFRYCAAGDFRLQRGKQSGLLRYPPTTACPWSSDRNTNGCLRRLRRNRGAGHATTVQASSIRPLGGPRYAERRAPEHEVLRVVKSGHADGEPAPPELVQQVGIGTRMPFSSPMDLPFHSGLSTDVEQPASPWRYPQE